MEKLMVVILEVCKLKAWVSRENTCLHGMGSKSLELESWNKSFQVVADIMAFVDGLA